MFAFPCVFVKGTFALPARECALMYAVVDDLVMFGTDQTDSSGDTNLGGGADNIDAGMLDGFSVRQ